MNAPQQVHPLPPAEILGAVSTVTASTGVSRVAVGVEYREDPESNMPWIVRINFRMARSRKGFVNSAEGYGATPQEAAADAVADYGRAVERGDVALGEVQ